MTVGKGRSLRANVGLLLVVLAALTGGTWVIAKLTIDHLLFRDAVSTGHNWARYLAQNVRDLEQIARGERPSAASMRFFERAQSAGQVFRYKIFDPQGRLRLVSDELTATGSDAQNLREHNVAAANAIAAGEPLVVAKEGKPPGRPPFFSEAYVPVQSEGRTVAIVEAYVDQTEKRTHFRTTFLLAAISLSLLTALAFVIPAAAWYRRTREKQHADDHIRFLAHHDAMTGLCNRSRLVEKLQQSLAIELPAGRQVALHYIDIDRFKDVNDTFGHDAGDGLLIATAERLRGLAGPHDVVARLGGDEFAVLQVDIRAVEEVRELAQRILSTLSNPYALNEHECLSTVSVGVATAPIDGDQPIRLMKSADLALYRSKADGRNCIRFFAPEMDSELEGRVRLERTIREATMQDRFQLHFQPLREMTEERLVGFEALLRLPTEDGCFIMPAEFIPVAEEMGMIGRIGAWVLREACRNAASWPEHLKVAVNLSAAQFASGDICEVVTGALQESGLPARRLELEITESLLLGDTEAVLAALHRLKAMGVSIAMDDFGTGYSSLSYLWRFPFDKIKIDRAFMTAFDAADANVEKIIRTIIALGRSLRMQITVEGIENDRQVDFVRELECDQAQGYFFGRPMPSVEVAALILRDFQHRLPRAADFKIPGPSSSGAPATAAAAAG